MFDLRDAFLTALHYHQAANLPAAEPLYRQVLAAEPDHADALRLLGLLLLQTARPTVALPLLEHARALRPDDADTRADLARALVDLHRPEEALPHLQHALHCRPDSPAALNILGNAFMALGRREEAIACFQRLIALSPKLIPAHNNLGTVLLELGRVDDAITAYRRALTLQPDDPQLHANIAHAFRAAGRLVAAAAALRQAIAAEPENPYLLCNLGTMLNEDHRADDALAAFDHALLIAPALAEVHNNRANILLDQGRAPDAVVAYRRAVELRPDRADLHSHLCFALHFDPATDPTSLVAEHRRWNDRHAPSPLSSALHEPSTRPPVSFPSASAERPLRIGYVSCDFCEHPVGRFLLPILAHHDRNAVDVFCYAHVPTPDGLTAELRAHTPHWRDIHALNDLQVIRQIREDRIDILVDLMVHTGRNRLLIFAYKPAPVQITYLGYCSTTGMPAIDYRLTDPFLEASDAPLAAAPERPLLLPETYWCYAPRSGLPEVTPLPALQNGYITFGNLNHFAKASAPALHVWAQLLQTLPNTRLLLHARSGSHRRQTAALFAAHEVDPQRLTFIDRLSPSEYFRAYEKMDIALDPFPFNGGTTTCDALWMGLPVITLAGRLPISRAGVSILSNVGLESLIASSEPDYIQKALTLAADLDRLAALRSTLRQRMQQSPLTNAPRFTRHLESLYRAIWQPVPHLPD